MFISDDMAQASRNKPILCGVECISKSGHECANGAFSFRVLEAGKKFQRRWWKL